MGFQIIDSRCNGCFEEDQLVFFKTVIAESTAYSINYIIMYRVMYECYECLYECMSDGGVWLFLLLRSC